MQQVVVISYWWYRPFGFLTPEDGTNNLSQNVGNNNHYSLHNNPEECSLNYVAGLLSVLHWVPLITHKANREAEKAEKLTFSWCTQLWIGSSMVCAVRHFKLNWNKTARQKNENSMTMCYKCACYYDKWYNTPVALKIQMHAGKVISLKYGDQVFMSFWHCICTYFHSLHLFFSSIKKTRSFHSYYSCLVLWHGKNFRSSRGNFRTMFLKWMQLYFTRFPFSFLERYIQSFFNL